MSNISLLKATITGGTEDRIAAVREFNRFYTNVLGLLQEGLLETPYSLAEARVIFELAAAARGTAAARSTAAQADATHTAVLADATQPAAGQPDATELRRSLDIDGGYLSRILARLETSGLIARRQSPADGRRQVITLTEPGMAAFRNLDGRSSGQVADLLGQLPAADQRRLTSAMSTVREILEGRPRPAGYVLRAPLPGDLGWVIRQHGAVYADEYRLDASFEALVARIVADYAERHDPQREAVWIAEVNGEPAGCVFCVRKSDTTGQLRLLLVDPAARGLGIGARLVDECISFARRAGYDHLVLWTNDVLTAARRVYEKAGFELVQTERHHSFGHDLTGQTWRLALR